MKDKAHLHQFFSLLSCIAPAIAVAHGFGRLGCLTAGCCHGCQTDSWCGIMMYGNMGYAKYIPTQLFEAIFLFLLCAFLVLRAIEQKKYNFSVYTVAYGVWRFFIEYVRADYRGSTFVSFLTPSQLVAIGFISAGIALAFVERWAEKKELVYCTPSKGCENE